MRSREVPLLEIFLAPPALFWLPQSMLPAVFGVAMMAWLSPPVLSVIVWAVGLYPERPPWRPEFMLMVLALGLGWIFGAIGYRRDPYFWDLLTQRWMSGRPLAPARAGDDRLVRTARHSRRITFG